MIKDTVLQHKLEKERLLGKTYFLRERLDIGKKFLDSDIIKVISGPRRAGKSVFSFLLLKDKDFAYLNFDDEDLVRVRNHDEIIRAIFEVYPGARYILFDEIQNLDDWELFVNKLQRRGFNLILTGSNANLLAKELATTLTGRYIAIEIFPFSFREFLSVKNFQLNKEEFNLPETKGRILNYLDEYLKHSGFPEVIVKNLELKTYLDSLFDAILLRDTVKRYNVRYSQKIYDLAIYLVSNFSNEFSFTRLKNILEFRSTLTVQNYLKYLGESYLFFSLNRFSFKVKEQIKTSKKNYVVDNGFIFAKAFQSSQDLGKLMENLVFLEILRKGSKANKDVFYYKTKNNREVDFILRNGLKIKSLIQVCYEVNPETKEREIKSLVEAGKELDCDDLIVINWEYEGMEEFKGERVNFIPLWKWILEE